MAGVIGVIYYFDGVFFSTYGAIYQNYVGETSKALVRYVELDNGTKINFDAAEDSQLQPGRADQIIKIADGGKTAYNALKDKKGSYGLIYKDVEGTGYEYCYGILEDVRVTGVHAPAAVAITLTLSFDFETHWVYTVTAPT